MNLTLPYSWLKEYLITTASVEKVAECLSLCGPSVEKLTKTKDGDYLLEIEVTTNRVDMMSVLGIAREAAAILPQFGFKASFHLPVPTKTVFVGNNFPLKLKVDQNLCPRFSAVIINNITLESSPQKIQDYLEKSGIRPINNVVDISNYLMRLFGQPVHTFDLNKIKNKMILRLSKKGEKLTTLDDKNFTLPGGDIVIEDGSKKLIDLCGIMGGLNSAVDNNTKNVLLFVQTYSAKHIRRTSMILGQRSEAAQIFEKQPDPETVMPALKYGIQLFKQWAGADQGSRIIDLYPQPEKPKTVTAPLQLIKDRLGIEITQKEVDIILESLGFNHGRVPSWRSKDINIPEDIVEEVARIYGYHRLPSQLMPGVIPTNYPEENFYLEQKIKDHLVSLGGIEIYTNSMVSQKLATASGYRLEEHLKIKNALSDDWLYLRRSLIPSHLSAIQANSQVKKITFFEIAKVYLPKNNSLPEEKLQLIVSSNEGYSHLKGIAESLFSFLHLPLTAEINSQTLVANLEPIIKSATLYPHYQPISSHPPVIEDLTFTLPEKTPIGPVLAEITKINKLIKSVSLSSIYQQNFTFAIKYQSLSKDLSAAEIEPIRKNIVTRLEKKFKSHLVGELD